LIYRESTCGILKSYNTLPLALELDNVWVLFELDLSSDTRRRGSHRDANTCKSIIRYMEVHIALNF
jgi:hypothetical protein